MEHVLISQDNGVLTITLNRPEKRNALTSAMMVPMLEAIEHFEADDRARVLLVDARGSAFCSGLDLSDMQAVRERQGWFDYELLPQLFERLAHHPNPTVAMIQGAAVAGGCELALHCDLRIGSPAARFSMPLARLGLVAPCEPIQRLVNTIGLTAARDMLMTGDAVDGVRAERLGLLARMVEPDQLAQHTRDLVARLAANAPLSMRAMKRTLDLMAISLTPDQQAEAEAERIRISRSEDMREGLRAFHERRTPVFRGV